MISQPGDYIGAGKTYNFTAPSATFTAQVLGSGSYTNDVDIAVTSGNDWFYYDFAAPNLARLVPGVYTGATRWPFEAANTPGLDIDGDGRGSNTLTGQFTVYQALYDGTGQITDFSASFEQHSEGATPALTGQILYHAALNRPAGVLANDADADGDPLTANLVTGPAHGTLMSFGADGSFAYTPAPGFFGTDQFTYRSNDGKANSNLATVTIAVKQTGVVADGGFESAAAGPSGYQYNPTGSSWTFSGGPGNGSGVSGNNSPFTAGNPAAPEGSQVAFLQGTGTITQTITGLAAGSDTLSFQAAQRGNYGTSNEDFQIQVDGVPVGTFRPTSTTYKTYTTPTFTVTAGTHTVRFMGLDSAGGDNTAFLDGVALSVATPPPVGVPALGDAGFRVGGRRWHWLRLQPVVVVVDVFGRSGQRLGGEWQQLAVSPRATRQRRKVRRLPSCRGRARSARRCRTGRRAVTRCRCWRRSGATTGSRTKTSRCWSTGCWWGPSRRRAPRTRPGRPGRSRWRRGPTR